MSMLSRRIRPVSFYKLPAPRPAVHTANADMSPFCCALPASTVLDSPRWQGLSRSAGRDCESDHRTDRPLARLEKPSRFLLQLRPGFPTSARASSRAIARLGDTPDTFPPTLLRASVYPRRWHRRAQAEIRFDAPGRVGLGGRPPRPPTDPYVLALEHTVPLMMDSPYSQTL